MPWKIFAAPQSGREYTALLSYLPLNKWRAMPRFMRYTLQIRRQLAGSEGLIGYSLDANVPSRAFWTCRCGKMRNPCGGSSSAHPTAT